MTYKSLIVAVIGASLLSACSSMQERQSANGNFDYLQEPETQRFKVPEDVDRPNFDDTYVLPSLGGDAPRHLLGDKLTVLSPALVLPLVAGSHVEEGQKEATIWFDQVDDSQPLDTTIWNSLLSYLEEQGIGVLSFDTAEQKLVTDWMLIEQEEDGGWFSWNATERNIGRRFEFFLDVKPHGRSAALKAVLRDYLETRGEDVIADLDAEQQRRNEVEILNQVVGHYEHQIRVADIERLKQIRTGLAMELGFDSDGEPAYVVDGEYDVVWPRMLLVLRKLGFNVKDLDKSNGLLFVNYGNEDSGWWSSLWGSNKGELDLEKDDYRLQINPLGEKTSVTLLDEENKPFTIAKVTELFASFSRIMAEDDLDI